MIKVKNVSKKFDKFVALNDFSMNVPEGVVYGLVGPNGAGKTTILKHLAGIYKQDKGEVLVNEDKIYDNEKIKKDVLYISDDLYFFNTYTILETAKFYSDVYKNFNWNKFNELKKVFNIDTKRKVNKLSKGMKKQVAFWITISCMPKIMILDEPIDGLDPIMKKKVWDLLLEDVKSRNVTVIVSSHNLKELETVCTYIGIIKNGEMILEKNLSNIESDINKIQVVFKEETNIENLEILENEKNGSVQNLIIKGNIETIKEEIQKHNPIILDVIPLTLEEVFMYQIGGEKNEGK